MQQPDKPLTRLQRAFRIFQSMSPNPMTASYLAALMLIDVGCAYDYIRRLKKLGRIMPFSRDGRQPNYVLIPGATMPPDDGRGGARLRTRASRPISQITAGRLKP